MLLLPLSALGQLMRYRYFLFYFVFPFRLIFEETFWGPLFTMRSGDKRIRGGSGLQTKDCRFTFISFRYFID